MIGKETTNTRNHQSLSLLSENNQKEKLAARKYQTFNRIRAEMRLTRDQIKR